MLFLVLLWQRCQRSSRAMCKMFLWSVHSNLDERKMKLAPLFNCDEKLLVAWILGTRFTDGLGINNPHRLCFGVNLTEFSSLLNQTILAILYILRRQSYPDISELIAWCRNHNDNNIMIFSQPLYYGSVRKWHLFLCRMAVGPQVNGSYMSGVTKSWKQLR